MLCIALLAFVVIEEASPAHIAMDVAEIEMSIDEGDAELALTENSTDQDQAPGSPVQPPHHCCAAHTGGIAPAPHAAALLAQVTLTNSVPHETGAALFGATDGLERPPKATAIV